MTRLRGHGKASGAPESFNNSKNEIGTTIAIIGRRRKRRFAAGFALTGVGALTSVRLDDDRKSRGKRDG
jgi:hypothetical protein